MNFKLVLICLVFIVEVNTECGDYLTCLSELIHGFFGTKPRNSTNNDNFKQTNESDLYEIRDFSEKHLDKILNQVSSLVKDNVTGDIIESRSKTAEYMNDKTKVLIKVFDFEKPIPLNSVKTVNTTTNENKKILDSEKIEKITTTEEQIIFVTLPSVNKNENLITTTENVDLFTSTENVNLYTSNESANSYTSYEKVNLHTKNENVNLLTTTENIKESSLTTDLIYQVNNMAVKFDDFENNLILPDIYVDVGDNNTDYPNIDYIELYKDVTIENVEFIQTEQPMALEDVPAEKYIENNLIDFSATEEKISDILNTDGSGIPEAVFPWIATIFIKNDTKDDQFQYYCDGALLSDRFVLTAGRCINLNNVTINADNILIVLGKKSLHAVGEDEKVHKVKSIKTHENFTIHDDGANNDLAVLELDEPTSLNGAIQPANVMDDISDEENAATTAWAFTGELTPIFFDKEASRKCFTNQRSSNTFCATYGNNVALCPSYGGLHVAKQTDRWYLRGIRTGDPENRGICLNRDITYTDLLKYKVWIGGIIAN